MPPTERKRPEFPSISLYIHIPFCKKKCRYCDFYSAGDAETFGDAYIGALVKEWERVKEKNALHDSVIETLYFGGGTPSVLSPVQWECLHREFTSRLHLSPGYEWSVEANPDSFTQEHACVWRAMGVNRVTLGVQSLDERELRVLGRPHDVRQARVALQRACAAGFSSVGADVMYGLPGQSVDGLSSTLEGVLGCGVNHLSAYELTIADDTPFGRHRSALPIPDEEIVVDMSARITSVCAEHGINRYEVSNYAQPGRQSRHNNAYWTHRPYVGLGPSAHSYLHPFRWSNAADTAGYVRRISIGESVTGHREVVGRTELMEECIFLGLRLIAGIEGRRFAEQTGEQFDSGHRSALIRRLVSTGRMTADHGRYALTPSGMIIADAITRELL